MLKEAARATGLEHLPLASAGAMTTAQPSGTGRSMGQTRQQPLSSLKANKKAFISCGLPEDDVTAAVVRGRPLMSWHSPIPLEVAEASAR